MTQPAPDDSGKPPNGAGPEVATATAHLRAKHEEEKGPLQRLADRLVAVVALPGFVALMTIAIALWMGGNLVMARSGLKAPDPPPFVGLELAMSAAALVFTALILTAQRREDQLSSHREQLILELAIMIDQKSSKLIKLIEESRRDNPLIADRIDDEAQTLSKPSDPKAVLEAIKDTGTAP